MCDHTDVLKLLTAQLIPSLKALSHRKSGPLPFFWSRGIQDWLGGKKFLKTIQKGLASIAGELFLKDGEFWCHIKFEQMTQKKKTQVIEWCFLSRERYIQEQLDKRLGRKKKENEAQASKNLNENDLYAIPKALQVNNWHSICFSRHRENTIKPYHQVVFCDMTLPQSNLVSSLRKIQMQSNFSL